MSLTEPPDVPEPSGATFVGRDAELAELLAGVDDARAGSGRLFLLAGEPGIGKSRLADELAAGARAQGVDVLWGRAWEDAGAPPYWPWIQVMRAHLRSVDPVAARRQMSGGAADIAQVLPELRATFPDLPPPPEASSESARFQLFDSVANFLRAAASARPVMVVLDDLHAADPASLLLLRFLASQLGDMRAIVVATYRDVELTPDHPLTATVAELTRVPVTRLLTLGGLPPTAVGQFIGATAGVQPHDLVVAAVWRETSGNPLFVGEAVRLLSAEGRLNDVTDLPSLRVSVPAGIRDVIVRRIQALGEDAARVLALGAALGPEFRPGVLRRVAELGAAETTGLLDTAAREGLLVSVGGGLDRYRFSHDLVREALHADLAPDRRVALHLRVVEVLEGLFAGSLDDHLEELAYHAFEAVRTGVALDADTDDPARPSMRAVDYARRAGERAARSLGYEEAARLYRMAIAVLARDLPDREEDRTEVLLLLGDAEARAGDLRGSRATFLQAAELARRTGVATHLARAALGTGGRLPWARPGRDTRLAPLLQDALVMLGGSDDRLRVRLLIRLACAWRSTAGQRAQSASLARQAVELARGLDDPATLTYALAGLYWATWWPENHEARLGLAEEMLGLAEELGDPERLIDAHLMLFMAYCELGSMSEARRKLDDVTALVEELRQPAHLWLGVAFRTLMALLDGQLERAEELLAREREPATPITPALDEVSAATFHEFLVRREQGRPELAERSVRDAVDQFPWYPLHRGALSLLLIDMVRVEEARSELAVLARDGYAALNRDNEWLLTMCLCAEAAALLRDEVPARAAYDLLAGFAGRHAIGMAEGSLGAVDRYLGLLAGALGQPDNSVRHLRQAVDVNRRLGAAAWLAHSQAELAYVLARTGDPAAQGEAGELTVQALEAAGRLGMTALAARIAPAAATDAAAPPAPATFRREGDFWTVALDGDPVRIRDNKGMHYIARLLAEPGREFHALDLLRGMAPDGNGARGAGSAARALADDDLVVADGSDAGPQLDEQAKAAYRERIAELDEEIAEAESWNDPERVARGREELAAIAGELSRAVGLGGRDRRAVSAAERARVSVTRAIRAAIERVSAQSPQVGDHLSRAIRTGTFCSYAPDPRSQPSWRL